MMRSPRVEILNLGSELLLGLRTNTHLSWLGDRFARRGVTVQRGVVVDDREEEIRRQFLDCWEQGDIILTTGGLGPTGDDITCECVAGALGLSLMHDPLIETQLEAWFQQRGRILTDINRKLAFRPEGSEALPNRMGTACGIWLEKDGKILIMLPGPPHELRVMVEEQVFPRLEAKGLLGMDEGYVQIRTAGLGESVVAEKLQPLIDLIPGVKAAYCLREGMVDCRLSADDGADVTMCVLQQLANRCAAVLDVDFVCFGHDTLEQIVFDKLRSRDLTLAVAESCTGGLLSNSFTDISGSSKVLLGGCVCYSNDAKVQMLEVPDCLLRQHGAVSSETAVAMAMGVAEKLEADYALSVTGFAGPGGGTETAPVGTVFLGLHGPDGTWSQKVHFNGDRVTVKKLAVARALDWLRRELNKKDLPVIREQHAMD